MSYKILGISAYYHDSAAALLIDGEIIAAAQEERFSRKKHDPSFPKNAINYVLDEGGLSLNDLDIIAFYDKPFIKFERLLETYHAFAPKGLFSFISSMPIWVKEKLFTKKLLYDELKKIGKTNAKLVFPEHHLSHAASAFYPSPFEEAAILTLDGVGEWATTTICHGKGNSITVNIQLDFPHSIGLLYSAFTYYCGFKVNSGEYKLMGLAPYGDPNCDEVKRFKNIILDKLVDIKEDGSLILNMNYFKFATGLRMCNDSLWEKEFGIPRRKLESEITEKYMNLALAIQQVTEDIVLKLGNSAKKLTGSKNLVMAGGVALNCVANGRLLKSGIFENIWIQPAAGDAGGSLGAAYSVWYILKDNERKTGKNKDCMKGAYLGPEFNQKDIYKIINKYSAPYDFYENFDDLSSYVAGLLNKGNVVGWFQGRMEFGPRALGSRSILGDPRNPDMQKKLNLKIKYRESFRPFAPTVLEEDIKEYFDLDSPSPYMLLVAPVKEDRRKEEPKGYNELSIRERLYHIRSDIPAITHIDYTARIQSVNKETNYRYWKLIKDFKEKTGYGLIVNTSFNVRGEPIVCTPEDAYRCFMRTEMDYLVINDFIFSKGKQPEFKEKDNWRSTYQLD